MAKKNTATVTRTPVPWDVLFPKQMQVFNCFKHILLISGSRLGGKTHSAIFKVVRHLWETPGARVGVFAKSKTLAKDGGSWNKLVNETIPFWITCGLTGMSPEVSMQYTSVNRQGLPGQIQDSATRTSIATIRNYWGGESSAMLFSIEHDQEIFDKVKNKEFSMVWVIELSMFKDPNILAALLLTLRVEHLRPQNGEPDTKRQFIADTNPDEEQGDESWIYQTFYKLRNEKPQAGKELTEGEKFAERYRSMMEVIEFFIEDNPTVTEDQKAILWTQCQSDPMLHDSWFYGKWGAGCRQKDRHFSDIFQKEIHVIKGELEDYDIEINPMSTRLYTGWDIGLAHHAAVIIDIWYRKEIRNGEEINVACFSILEEHCADKEQITLHEYATEFMKKLENIEKAHGKTYSIISYADDSATNVHRPTSGTFDNVHISVASKGRIELIGTPKPVGSQEVRVDLVRVLLKEQRIFIAARCVRMIEMFMKLRRSKKEFIVWGDYKHIFDALSYALYEEMQRIEIFKEQYPGASSAPTSGVSIR